MPLPSPSPPSAGFAIQLNEVTPGLEGRLAPTDCRLRPDQHALELGRYDEANAEKQRLEHKQRAARKAAERGEPLRPRWFDVLDADAADGCADGAPPASHPARGGQAQQLGRRASSAAGDHHPRLRFRYKGGYWEERAAGRFTGCRDIFGAERPQPQ
eukprot:scaffold17.g569.t1